MKQTETSIIFRNDYPVFTFDIQEDELLVFIYQVDGVNKISVRNLLSNKEIFYYDMQSSFINCLVRFICNKTKLFCYDGNTILIIDYISKNFLFKKSNIDDCVYEPESEYACVLTSDGRIIRLNISTFEEIVNGKIGNYNPGINLYQRKLIDYSVNKGWIMVIADHILYVFNIELQLHSHIYSKVFENSIKWIATNESSTIIGIVYEARSKLDLYSFSGSSMHHILRKNVMLNLSCIKIRGELLLVASNTGYFTVSGVDSESILYSEQHHHGVLRDIVINNEGNVYTSGDDGKIIKLKGLIHA